MHILSHFTANDEQLQSFDFKRELSMTAYLIENEGILNLGDPYIGIEIVDSELSVSDGQKRKGTDGRIDLLITYDSEIFCVVECKLGELQETHLEQLEDYLLQKDEIRESHPDAIDQENTPSPKWIGLLVGSSIDTKLAQKISDGYLTKENNIPIAALTLRRFKNKNGNVYVVTDTYINKRTSAKDYTKYTFEGVKYGKGQLVLAVMKKYAADHPDVTFAKLLKEFPKSLQGNSGVFDTLDEANKIYNKKGRKRHFLNPDQHIELAGATTIAICSQWGVGNIDKFIKHAKDIGCKITVER